MPEVQFSNLGGLQNGSNQVDRTEVHNNGGSNSDLQVAAAKICKSEMASSLSILLLKIVSILETVSFTFLKITQHVYTAGVFNQETKENQFFGTEFENWSVGYDHIAFYFIKSVAISHAKTAHFAR